MSRETVVLTLFVGESDCARCISFDQLLCRILYILCMNIFDIFYYMQNGLRSGEKKLTKEAENKRFSRKLN